MVRSTSPVYTQDVRSPNDNFYVHRKKCNRQQMSILLFVVLPVGMFTQANDPELMFVLTIIAPCKRPLLNNVFWFFLQHVLQLRLTPHQKRITTSLQMD